MRVFLSPDGTEPRWAWTEGLERAGQHEFAVPMAWQEGDARDQRVTDLLAFISDALANASSVSGEGGDEAAAMPTIIQPGETLAYGWTTLGFRASAPADAIGPGFLVVQELADPLGEREDRWVDGADQALDLLALQAETRRRNIVPGTLDAPHRSDLVFTCTHVPPIGFLWAYPVAAQRSPYEEASGESGWFFSCYDQPHNHEDPREREQVHLHELVTAFPRILPYLALAVGTAVIFTSDQVVIFRPDDDEGYVDPAGLA